LFNRLYAEIIRRQMHKTVAGYLVLVISILTGADLLFPALIASDELYSTLVWILVGLLPLVILLSWFFNFTRDGIKRAGSGDTILDANRVVTGMVPAGATVEVEVPTEDKVQSVAVLPFVNSCEDTEGDYLSDGITETIINKLTRLSDVRVVPRASAFRYKGSDLPPSEICRELKVRTTVTGSISHVGNRLIVQAELVDAANEAQLWGERYNGEWANIFDVQEEIATQISAALKPALSREEQKRLEKRETLNVDAYQEYLRGRFLWNKRTPSDVIRSIDHFQAALEQDPLYALAYSGLADAYNILGYYSIKAPKESYPLAKDADRKALEIDAGLAEAYASLGYATLFYDRDWEAARENFERAIELGPNYGTAHQWYAWYLLVMERFDDALVSFQKAASLDPLSQIINDHLAYGYLLVGDLGAARDQIERTRALAPRYPLALWRLGDWHLAQKQYEPAVRAYAEAESLSEGIYMMGYLGMSYGLLGERDEALKVLRRLDERAAERYVSPLDRALIHAGLGQVDEAYAHIDAAREIRVSDMARFKLLPWPDCIREDARFQATARALNLPL
jgi:TolB-like protein/Tfp pilus assembly protein PilF